MKFLNFVIFFSCLYQGVENLDVELIKFGLFYYKSHSVVLLHDNISLCDVKYLLTYLNGMYWFSVMTFSNFEKSFKLKYQDEKTMVVVFNYGEDFIEMLNKLSHTGNLSSYKWLLTTTKFNLENFKTVKIPLMSEVIIAEGQPLEGYKLTEIYETEPGVKLCNFLGKWTNGVQKLNISTDIFARRRNLKGARIKVVSPSKDPCSKRSFAEGVASIAICVHNNLWIVLAEMLNATTETIIEPNLTLNTLLDTGAELTFRSSPLNFVDAQTRSFLWPVFNAELYIVTSYIEQQFEWRTFILPFSNEMWLCVMICIVLFDLIILSAEFLTTRGTYREAIRNYWSKYSFGTFYAFCDQSVSDAPSLISYRVIFLLIFVVPIVLLRGYSAIVTSYLTVPLRKKPFRNLEELSQRKDYDLGWHRTFPSEFLFNPNSTDPIDQAVIKNNVLPKMKLPATDIEAVERLCTSKFSFLTILPTVRALKPKCKYFRFQEYYRIVFSSIEIKKDSWYFYFLNRCERTVDFTKTLFKIITDAIIKYVSVKEEVVINIEEPKPIVIGNIILPFMVLLLGVLFSTILLLLEIFYFKRNPRYMRRKRWAERHAHRSFIEKARA